MHLHRGASRSRLKRAHHTSQVCLPGCPPCFCFQIHHRVQCPLLSYSLHVPSSGFPLHHLSYFCSSPSIPSRACHPVPCLNLSSGRIFPLSRSPSPSESFMSSSFRTPSFLPLPPQPSPSFSPTRFPRLPDHVYRSKPSRVRSAPFLRICHVLHISDPLFFPITPRSPFAVLLCVSVAVVRCCRVVPSCRFMLLCRVVPSFRFVPWFCAVVSCGAVVSSRRVVSCRRVVSSRRVM